MDDVVGTIRVVRDGTGRIISVHLRVLDSTITAEEAETIRARILEARPSRELTVERVPEI